MQILIGIKSPKFIGIRASALRESQTFCLEHMNRTLCKKVCSFICVCNYHHNMYKMLHGLVAPALKTEHILLVYFFVFTVLLKISL